MTNHGVTHLIDAPSHAEQLDVVGEQLNNASHALQRPKPLGNALRGTYMGSPMHPGIVWIPTGLSLAAGLLAMRSSTHHAAKGLVIGSLLTTPIAAMTGLAEAASIRKRGRRIASLHATANTVGALCQAFSLINAREGKVSRGWLYSGLLSSMVAGMWGRHLSFNYRAELIAPLEPVVDVREDHMRGNDHERPRDKGKSPHTF